MMSNVARDSDRARDPPRRHVLRSLGVSVVVGAGLAGCLGDDDEEEPDDGSTDSDGDDEPGDETGDEADDDSTDDVGDDDSDPVPVFEVDQLYPVQIDVEHWETFNAAAGIGNTGDAEGTQEIELASMGMSPRHKA